MANEFKRVLATLDNGTALYLFNMDMSAEFTSATVLSSQPILKAQADGAMVYKFNHTASGWFASIKADDQDRLPVLRQLADGTILCQVSAPVTHTAKDFASAEPFLGAK